MWDANRRVKLNHLVATLNPEEMRCGLSTAQLLALLKYAADIGGSSRFDKSSNKERVHGWLLGTPRKGHTLTDFRSRCGSEDGATLWRFFEEHEEGSRRPEGPQAAASSLLLLVQELRDAEAARARGGSPSSAAVPTCGRPTHCGCGAR
mmetsp:Transcript_35930/g.89694  ORF Transcript_35930/g.89694 Transcript_35930/m.89694 type:complete len:149 (+) Transcript_35930:532-978(+)